MKRFAIGLALLALAAGAQAQQRMERRGAPPGGDRGQRGSYANPSAAIAAEIAFAQLVRDKGQLAAVKATATEDAVMFAPAMMLAQQWLKTRPTPTRAVTRQPYQVWSSCDGSLMVTNGGWQQGDRHGWFTTVWQRQPKDGSYKWVFGHGGETAAPLETPDMIAAKVADCPERRAGERPAGRPPEGRRRQPAKPAKTPPVPFDPTRREGKSNDGTLTWQVTADAAGTRDFTARLMIDGQMQDIRKEHVAGPTP